MSEKNKKEKPKPKHYYDVKVECMIPATLTYKILAEDEHQAVTLIKGKTPIAVNHKLIGRKEKVLRVYQSGCSVIKLMLNFWSGKNV